MTQMEAVWRSRQLPKEALCFICCAGGSRPLDEGNTRRMNGCADFVCFNLRISRVCWVGFDRGISHPTPCCFLSPFFLVLDSVSILPAFSQSFASLCDVRNQNFYQYSNRYVSWAYLHFIGRHEEVSTAVVLVWLYPSRFGSTVTSRAP